MPEGRVPAGPEPVEVRLAWIEERLASVQKHGATKTDVEHMGRVVIMWTVATGLVVASLLLTLLPRLVS